ncbi:hypothetical protein GCM10020000_75240 [Streptomyces olivoverticillatus]
MRSASARVRLVAEAGGDAQVDGFRVAEDPAPVHGGGAHLDDAPDSGALGLCHQGPGAVFVDGLGQLGGAADVGGAVDEDVDAVADAA